MPKRFTATEKWADTWFRALSPLHKLGWQYLCDNCDCAGVIDLDRELANFQVRDTLDWDALIEAAAERIVRLNCGKLWLTRFISFQYGVLTAKCSTHVAVIKILDKYASSERVIQEYRKGLPTLKDKDKDTDKDKVRKGIVKGKPKKQISAAEVPLPEGFTTREVVDAVRDWLDYKAKRGESYKDAAHIGRKVAEFVKSGPAAFVAAVNSSIGNGYSGLFPAKDFNGNQPTTSRVGPGQRYRG